MAALNPILGCGTPHTRRLARSSRWQLQSLCRTVHKLRDARIRKFFPLAVTEFLPTERRLTIQKAAGGRGDVCKLCWRYRESVRHVYVCDSPELRAGRRALVVRTVSLLRNAGVRVVRSVGPPGPRAPTVRGVALWIPVWFDLEEEFWMWVYAPHGTLPGLRTRDRYGDVLGLVPVGLEGLLDRVWVRGQWQRRPLGQVQELQDSIALELLVGAHSVWIQRCALVNAWFRSPEARKHRMARVLEMAAQQRGRSEATSKRQLRKWLSKHPEASSARASRLLPPTGSIPSPGPPAAAGALGPDSDPIASRLRPRPCVVDPGFFVRDEVETIDELAAEAEKKLMQQDMVPSGGTAALPYY